MIRLCSYMVCFFFSFWATGQYSTNQNEEGIGNYNGPNTTEMTNLDSGLSSNLSLNDSNYHAGASKALALDMDTRRLTSTYCVSCHDGVLVKASHTTTNFGNPEGSIGLSAIFSFNHPVAFEFTKSLALSKTYLNDPYSTPSGLGGTIAEDLLVDGRVECITCHNIFFSPKHKEKYEVLNKSNESAALCLTCHNI